MKKLISLFLLFPYFFFAQGNQNNYKRTISLSQFVEELKQAANSGSDYLLEDCYVTYGNYDKKYLSNNNSSAVIDQNLNFSKDSKVTIRNCKFGDNVLKKEMNQKDFKQLFGFYSSTITFKNAYFGDLIFFNVEADIRLENIIADIGISYEVIDDNPHTLEVLKSNINGLYLNCKKANKLRKIDYEVKVSDSQVNFCIVRDVNKFRFENNKVSTVIVDGKSNYVLFKKNEFFADFNNILYIKFNDIKEFIEGKKEKYNLEIDNYTGIEMGRAEKFNATEINQLEISENIFNNILPPFSKDTLLEILAEYEFNIEKKNKYLLKWFPIAVPFIADNWPRGRLKSLYSEYNTKWSYTEKINFYNQVFLSNDSIKIIFNNSPKISIKNSDFNHLKITDNLLEDCYIRSNRIKRSLEIQKTKADSLMFFYKNNIPEKNNIIIDESVLYNLGFNYKGKKYYGSENYDVVKDLLNEEEFKEHFRDFSAQYRQFISIFHEIGSDIKSEAVIAFKSFQTKRSMYKFHQQKNILDFLNWRGGEFLGVYCDYGLNPFKGLRYCFYVILFFAGFYFFFYSDWDHIDKKFLINRFSSLIGYFSSDKKMQDFLSDSYEKHMKVSTDFKLLIEENKAHTPLFLRLVFFPLYQLSLLRYSLMILVFNKIEVMSGKWGDLNNNKRYIIGTITFFSLLVYIIYLIIVRAINAIILSLNSFSTLGFGQVPVRGVSITKYLTVIEGFVGWFLLGVFIVSLLNQMSTI